MTPTTPSADEPEPRVHSGKPYPPWPAPDWIAELTEAKARERERIAAMHDPA